MSDLADNLSAKQLPIPTAQRLDVFVAGHLDDDVLKRWETQAGTTNFWRWADCVALGKQPSNFCGIVLFAADPDGSIDGNKSQLLLPFYARAGSEANVFQWQPIEKNFVRRDQHWFDERRSD
jgi:hypothetical protein